MDTAWAGKPVCFYEELASTNLQAKLDAENGAREGTLIVADMQTAGRGRRGRNNANILAFISEHPFPFPASIRYPHSPACGKPWDN